ncbi:Secreted effector protein PipB2 [Acaryochloris thomasi RCC1774]|uniref:Secreted effector protein PipB2 n=1 Tax=Acaryochloris thomasi RCC1774 TaxID=1764569 RepID=A0A2W1JAF7_9CYAN|nr:pentapeptide repeat-containing protein [Acaryochloris thomasi]PZD71139.1 Secreted effector protein PipB2 [Acaryochloris thomasi RCC1774]
MRFKFEIASSLLTLLCIITPAVAENPVHVRQLLNTSACQGCDLSGADLTQAHLIGGDLRDANLRGAVLVEANLEGADLTGADLTGANLSHAFLTNSCLNETNLTGVNFSHSIMYHAEAENALIRDITLTDAEIYETPISVGGPIEN